MRTKNLFYTLALGAVVASCSQEEIVKAPAIQSAGESFAEYSGEVFNGGISFFKDGGEAESRMAITNGSPSWVDGDKVGLVWTNALVEKEENGDVVGGLEALQAPWTTWPGTNLIFSNTRMTYDANSNDFFMTDGQVFKGMYFAYYPYNEAIQSVQQFKVSQANEQMQANSTTETLNGVAADLVWMSQRYEVDEEVMTDATFLYPLVEDDVESGTSDEINIRMKPFSNILDARFLIVDKKEEAATELDPAVVKVEKVILGSKLTSGGVAASNEFGGLANIPTVAAFDLSNWGSTDDNFDIPSSGQSGKDGRKLTVNSASQKTGFYEGEKKVGTVSVGFDAVEENAGKTQRVNFMFLPHKTTYAAQAYEIKVITDYGYAIIPESEWMKTATNQGGLYVNPTASDSQVGLTESFLLKNLTERIGMQAVRYFNLDIADLIYNDLYVGSTEELLEVLNKWNILNESGELRVHLKDINEFADFDWCADSKYDEVKEFLADPMNDLLINGGEMNLVGETHIYDTVYDQLHFNTALVDQESGSMTIEGIETIPGFELDEEAELLIPENATLKGNAYNLKGNTLIETDGELSVNDVIQNKGSIELEQNAEMKITGSIAWISNEGTIITNGIIESPILENKATGVFRIKTHSNTDVDKFTNFGEVYYDEQGKCTAITNKYDDGGRIIATVLEGASANTLADYIIAANAFKCTDLVINKNDYFTTGQWDNSLSTKALNSFKNVLMNEGVVITFTKGLQMKNATVTIAENAEVTWNKGVTVDTPEFKIKDVVVEAGATLNVSEINVANTAKTKVKIGGGLTTTIDGITCFNNEQTETITAVDGTSGTIDIK